jgi:hypothetical protein
MEEYIALLLTWQHLEEKMGWDSFIPFPYCSYNAENMFIILTQSRGPHGR